MIGFVYIKFTNHIYQLLVYYIIKKLIRNTPKLFNTKKDYNFKSKFINFSDTHL